MRLFARLAAGLTIAAAMALPASAGLNVTALDHSGFLFEDGKTKIIVDALIEPSEWPYRAPSPELRSKMEKGEAPFDGISLMLISHDHTDHYSPEATIRFLAANPKALVVTTGQVRQRLATVEGFAAVKKRILAPELAWKDKLVRKFNGVTVEIDRLRHGDNGKWASDLDAFIFTLGGKKVLYATATGGFFPEEYAELGYAKRGFDLAFVNFYMAIDAAKADKPAALKPDRIEMLKTEIGAKTTVLMHITPKVAPDVEAMMPALIQALPGVTWFPKEMESRVY